MSTMRQEKMLFDYSTTNRTDFRGGKIEPPIFTTYKPKPSCMRIRPPPLRDVHTLSDWKAAAIPFNILHRAKEITGKSPSKLQEPCSKPVDHGREESQRTRPRLVMTPAVSMDDITAPRARSILCEDMYISDMTRGLREAVSPYYSVTAPLPGLPSPANPVVLPKLQPPMISPEWRMETVTWDNKQLRAYCDVTRYFWLKNELPKCRACDESKTVAAQRKMERQLAKWR